MVRMQIQLTDEQAGALRREAARRGVSMAALVREVIDEALAAPVSARRARARAAIGRFSSGRSTVSLEHDRELDEAFSS